MIPTSIDGTDITGATIDGQDVQEITVDGDTVFSAGPSFLDNVVITTSWSTSGGSDYRGMAFTTKVSNITRIEVVLGDSGNSFEYPSVELGNVDTGTEIQNQAGPFNEGDTVVFNHNFSNNTEFGVAVETEDGTNSYAFSSGFSNGTSSVADVTGDIAYNDGTFASNSKKDVDLAIQELRFFG